MNKIASSHVEMIISFVLFAGFLTFLFLFLNPVSQVSNLPEVEIIKDKVIKEVSSDTGKLSIIVGSSNDCYSGDLSGYGSDFIEVKDVNNLRRYTLYFGDFFDSNLVNKISCLDKEGNNFTLGGFLEGEIVVYDKVSELKERYDSNYLGLRDSLDVEEFTFTLYDLDRNPEIDVDGRIPGNIVVASIDVPINVIYDDARMEEKVLNVRAW